MYLPGLWKQLDHMADPLKTQHTRHIASSAGLQGPLGLGTAEHFYSRTQSICQLGAGRAQQHVIPGMASTAGQVWDFP